MNKELINIADSKTTPLLFRYFYSKKQAKKFGCGVILYNGDEIPYTEISSGDPMSNYDDIVEVFRHYGEKHWDYYPSVISKKYKGKYLDNKSNNRGITVYLFEINENPDKMPEANTKYLDKNTTICVHSFD